MNTTTASKVPEATLAFWITKVLATTLGETAGDAVTMSMHAGYLLGTAIFGVLFLAAVAAQIRASTFRPGLYWLAMVGATTVGTTMADFADRSLGIGYPGGASLLFALLMASFFAWHRATGSLQLGSVSGGKSDFFYWLTIMCSQTLGTALGDWTADSLGLGYAGDRRDGAAGGAMIGVIGGMVSATVLAIFFVPLFFVLIMRYFTKYRPRHERETLAAQEAHHD